MGFESIITQGADDKKDIKSQADLQGQPFPVLKWFRERLDIEEGPLIIESRNIGGETGIYGNEAFGIYGESRYGSSATQSFILGNPVAGILGVSKLGSLVSEWKILRIINPNDTHTERFFSTKFKDASTTAIWTGNGELSFIGSDEATSKSVDYNNGIITQAKLTAKIDSGDFDFYLTANGTDWEEVTNGEWHTFTNTGSDLRWKIVEAIGEAGKITKLTINAIK